MSHDSANRPLSPGRKLVFAVAAIVLSLAALEFILALAGVRPGVETEDPYVGFVRGLPLFEQRTGPGDEPLMVTAPRKLTLFNQQAFPLQKDEDTVRIFCLGGSTTFGRPYDDRTSFPGWLRAYLRAADPMRRWEVVNAGGVSYASYRVALLMEELVAYEPDLFIVYTGQNEFLERRTYGSIQRAPAWVRELNVVLGRTRLFTAVQSAVQSIRGTEGRRATEGITLLPAEVRTILDGSVGPRDFVRDDELRSDVVAHFEFNLRRMIDMARRAGARIVFVRPASNLSDCSPFKSEFSADLGQEERARWSLLMDEARDARTPRLALERVEQALNIDPRRADAHYLRGRLLLELGDVEGARGSFERALEEDVCPLRAVQALHAALVGVCRERDVPLVDFPALLERHSPNGIPGKELFLDHVHPTIEGNRMLGETLLDELVRVGVVRSAPSWGAQARAAVDAEVLAGVDQRAHAAALRNLSKVLDWAGKSEEAADLARRAVALDPDDPGALLQVATVHQRAGELAEAERLLLRALEIAPESGKLHAALGGLYLQADRVSDALAELRRAARIRADDPEILNNLGVAHYRSGDPEAAIRSYEQVRAIDPNHVRSWNNQGSAELQLRRFDDAIRSYSQALELAPNYAEALYGRGVAQGQLHQDAAAIQSMQKVLEIEPDHVQARFALGVLYRRGERFREAAREFRAVLQLDPLHEAARSNLRQLEKN